MALALILVVSAGVMIATPLEDCKQSCTKAYFDCRDKAYRDNGPAISTPIIQRIDQQVGACRAAVDPCEQACKDAAAKAKADAEAKAAADAYTNDDG